jgi:hypothetical protein
MNELNLDQLSAISGGKKPILLALSVSVQVQTENGLSANQRAKAKFSSKISDQVTAVRGLSPTPFPWANGEEKDLISCPATSGGDAVSYGLQMTVNMKKVEGVQWQRIGSMFSGFSVKGDPEAIDNPMQKAVDAVKVNMSKS